MFWTLVSVVVTDPGYSSRRKNQSEKESGDQTADVGSHADLWRRKIKGDLNHYD